MRGITIQDLRNAIHGMDDMLPVLIDWEEDQGGPSVLGFQNRVRGLVIEADPPATEDHEHCDAEIDMLERKLEGAEGIIEKLENEVAALKAALAGRAVVA